MDDKKLSEWFEGTEGLRPACALSPLPSNIFFSAALEIVLVRFSKDIIILKGMVYLGEEGGGNFSRTRTESRVEDATC